MDSKPPERRARRRPASPDHRVPVDGTRGPVRHGLARVLSKLGLCSRSQAEAWIRAGRVELNGRVVRDPETPARAGQDRIRIDGKDPEAPSPVYLMLNKPRGLVTTASDERGRDTVYRCFEGAELDWIAPVGRLDQASEGLLLFSNDPEWAARIADPARGPDKTYHVQVSPPPSPEHFAQWHEGIVDRGERLQVKSARQLRSGGRTAWLEIVLDEGRNRQIRRLLAASGLRVLRLLRVAIGSLALGELGKSRWRRLTDEERDALATPTWKVSSE